MTGTRVPEAVRLVKQQYGPLLKELETLTPEEALRNLGAAAEAPKVDLDGQTFATVPRHDARAAAGGGVLNLDGPPIDHLAFSAVWLAQNGIHPGHCVLINAQGQSMEPSIWDGDLVMIDRRRGIRNGRIYVFTHPEDGTRIKRLELVEGLAITALSDNQDHPPEHFTGEAMNTLAAGIIGQVIWSGHKWA